LLQGLAHRETHHTGGRAAEAVGLFVSAGVHPALAHCGENGAEHTAQIRNKGLVFDARRTAAAQMLR